MLLSQAKPPKKGKKHPKKVEGLPGIFYKTGYGCMCKCFFLGVGGSVLLFCLVVPQTL